MAQVNKKHKKGETYVKTQLSSLKAVKAIEREEILATPGGYSKYYTRPTQSSDKKKDKNKKACRVHIKL